MKNKHRIKQCLSLLLAGGIALTNLGAVMPAFAEGLEIRAAQLHNDAGMVGAVYYFRQSRGEN